MATILILMEGETSLDAFFYYRRHREELKDERTLAHVWLTKGKEKPYEKNLIQSIDSIIRGIVIDEEEKRTYKPDPLYVVKEGDILQRYYNATFSEKWVYEKGNLIRQ